MRFFILVIQSLNLNSSKDFEKVDSLAGNEDVVKNLVKVISKEFDKFWAKIGKTDPAKKLRGF